MDDGLTQSERAMLSALPRCRVPSAALEDRVVTALVRRGLLRRATMALGGASWRVVTQLAAAAAVFAIGVLVGRTQAAAVDVPASEARWASGPIVEAGECATALTAPKPRTSSLTFAPVVGGSYMASVVTLPSDTVEALARFARDLARMTFKGTALQLARTRADTVVAMSKTGLESDAISGWGRMWGWAASEPVMVAR